MVAKKVARLRRNPGQSRQTRCRQKWQLFRHGPCRICRTQGTTCGWSAFLHWLVQPPRVVL